MFRLVSYARTDNAAAPFDGPPDAFGGGAIGTAVHRTLNCMKCVYSFAVNGGAVGNIPLSDDLGNLAILPPGAVIVESFSNWTTALTGSNNAAISVASAAAADLLVSTAKSSLSGVLAGTPVFTTATMIALGTTATGYQVYLNALTTAITAGVGSVYIFYVF